MILSDLSFTASESQNSNQNNGRPPNFRPNRPEPSFFQRITSWLNFFGDEANDRPYPPVPNQHRNGSRAQQIQQADDNRLLKPPPPSPPLSYATQPPPSLQQQQLHSFNLQPPPSSYGPPLPMQSFSVQSVPSIQLQPSSTPFFPSQQSIFPHRLPNIQVVNLRDVEETTTNPDVAVFKDVDYRPCDNLPWIPVFPQDLVRRKPPIKLQSPSLVLRPQKIPDPINHIQQNIFQHQLQQQQQQLQNLQLQQIQIQQLQIQQQLEKLKPTTERPPEIITSPSTEANLFTNDGYKYEKPVEVFNSFNFPKTEKIVSAGYKYEKPFKQITYPNRQATSPSITSPEYALPSKLLPLQNENDSMAPIPLPNLSLTPIPPLFSAVSFNSNPYRFYEPYSADDEIVVGHPKAAAQAPSVQSLIKYSQPDPVEPDNRLNDTFSFDIEHIGSSSSNVYSTIPYAEDHKAEGKSILIEK